MQFITPIDAARTSEKSAAANSAPRVLGCPGAWDAAAALLSGADSTRCALRSGGCGQHRHTRSTPLPVAERG